MSKLEIEITDGREFIDLDTFLQMVNMKKRTVIKRMKEMPLIIKEGEQYKVLKGTRYPIKVKNYKIVDDWDRRYVLLKAISENKYINAAHLGIYENTFKKYLLDFLELGYIQENYCGNNYGANAYDCTIIGADIAKKSKEKAKYDLLIKTTEVSATFAGVALSKMLVGGQNE